MQQTSLVLAFSTALDATSADNVSNYQIVNEGGTGVGGNQVGQTVPVSTATYDPSTLTVTLIPAQLLDLQNVYQLTVIGTPPSGLTSSTGVALDGAGTGTPGTNYVVSITGKLLAGPSPTAMARAQAKLDASIRKHGRFSPAAVDAFLAMERLNRDAARFRRSASIAKCADRSVHDLAIGATNSDRSRSEDQPAFPRSGVETRVNGCAPGHQPILQSHSLLVPTLPRGSAPRPLCGPPTEWHFLRTPDTTTNRVGDLGQSLNQCAFALRGCARKQLHLDRTDHRASRNVRRQAVRQIANELPVPRRTGPFTESPMRIFAVMLDAASNGRGPSRKPRSATRSCSRANRRAHRPPTVADDGTSPSTSATATTAAGPISRRNSHWRRMALCCDIPPRAPRPSAGRSAIRSRDATAAEWKSHSDRGCCDRYGSSRPTCPSHRRRRC